MQIKQNGFTIVELLIVIVVVGILAAIVITSFGGVQNRAKTAAAVSLGKSIAKTAESYNLVNGRYPTPTELVNSPGVNPSLITTSFAMPTTEKHVRYANCGTAPITGAQVTWKTFPAGYGESVLGECS